MGLQSVGSRLVAVILAAMVPLAGAVAYIWWQALQEGRARELRLLQATVTQMERDLRNLWGNAAWVMPRMASRPAFRELSPGACNDEMAVMREVNTAFLAITLWNREGKLVCSSFPLDPDKPAPEPHRASFEAGLRTDGLYLSDVFPGRISGLRLVTFTYPVKDAAGAVHGLLSIPVRTEYFETLLLDMEARAGSAAGIIDRNLNLVVRVPGNKSWQGMSVSALPGVVAGLRAPEGTFETTDVDGVRRIVAQKATPMGWRVYYGVSEAALSAGFRRQMVQGIAVFAIVIAISLALAWLFSRSISRPFRNLVAVTDAVAKGDLSARAASQGGGEIAVLAGHVNRMLDALEESGASLQDRNRRLREIAARLLNAEEEERKRISRGLHDQVGQELTAIKILLDTLAKSVQDPVQRAQIVDIATAAGETLQRVRQISVDLRPPQLDSLGLAAALRAHVERQGAIGKTATHFNSRDFPRKLAPELEIVVFRVVQEALTNVLRHSGAANAWVDLTQAGGEIRVEVRDDGNGFDPGSAFLRDDVLGGIGLFGVQERVALAGGALDIRSQPGQGCTIVATLPLPAGAKGTA